MLSKPMKNRFVYTFHLVEYTDAEKSVIIQRYLQVYDVHHDSSIPAEILILAIAVFLVWCRVRRERVAPVADLFVTVIPLAHAFGRVGCFFYGCCYGRLSGSSLAVAFPRHSPAWNAQLAAGMIDPSAPAALPVLPTQLFEAAAVLCLFAALLFVFVRNWSRRPGFTTGCYLVGYASIRFGLEFLRDDMRQRFGAVSIGQVISIGLFILGITFVLVSLLRSRAENCKIFGPTN